MRPATFTDDAIIQAGKDMQAIGKAITGFGLRQIVGGGNPSRLKQIWDAYQNNQAGEVQEKAPDLPDEIAEAVAAASKTLAERLNGLAMDLNCKAVKAAERRVNEVLRSAAEQKARTDEELDEAAKIIEQMEAEKNKALDELEAADQEAIAARREAAKLAGKMEAMQDQINELLRVIAERPAAQPTAPKRAPRPTKAKT